MKDDNPKLAELKGEFFQDSKNRVGLKLVS